MRRWGLLVISGIALGLLAYWCGMRQFGGFDQSVIIDVAWRLMNGQRPYVDFPCTLPVGFYLGAELAFRVFGVYWRSIVMLNALWSAICFVWLAWLLQAILRRDAPAYWGALACVTISTVAVGYWWYNPVTNLAGAVYAASVVAVLLAPVSWGRWASFCVSLFVVALMKPNVAAILIAGGTLSLFAFGRARGKALVFSLLALGLWLLAIGAHGSTIQQVLAGYLSVGGRGLESERFLGNMSIEERFIKAFLLIAFLAPWTVRWKAGFRGGGRPIAVFAFFCAAAGVYGAVTNAEMAIVHLPVLLIGALFVTGSVSQDGTGLDLSDGWERYLRLGSLCLVLVGVAQGIVRERVRGVGDFFEYEEKDAGYPIPFFRGLHAGFAFHEVVNEIASLCGKEDMKGVYFGNRLQWAYAAFGLQSPKGLPIWWDPGASIALKDQDLYLKKWLSFRFNPVLVMDAARLSYDFQYAIALRYGLSREERFPTRSVPPLHVLVRRDEGGAALPVWYPMR